MGWGGMVRDGTGQWQNISRKVVGAQPVSPPALLGKKVNVHKSHKRESGTPFTALSSVAFISQRGSDKCVSSEF